MVERFLCSAASQSRGEAALGSASRVDRWLLLEAPGAWDRRALPRSRDLADETLRALQQAARDEHARTLLVRHVRDRPGRGERRVFAADSRPGRERLLTRTVRDGDLPSLRLPFEDATGWAPAPPLIAVCTHGAHDTCCAVRGRPVAAALAAAYPDQTWEVSHLGGDRFAPNVLVLPGGHYLGRLDPHSAVGAVAELLAGRRPDPFYRGRSCWAMPVQAALALVGARLGVAELSALHPVRLVEAGAHRWSVTLERRVAGGAVGTGDTVGGEGTGEVRLEAVVAQRHGPEHSRLTCHAERAVPVPHWELASLQ